MKILGIDYGKKKIGLAMADSQSKLIQPLGVLFKNEFFTILQSGKIFGYQLKDFDKIIIGKPFGKIDQEIEEFKKNLEKAINLPVEFFDETLTTFDAQSSLRTSPFKKKSKIKKEDALAASFMLEYYLASCSS